jgi:hypothetical protein
MSLVLADEFVYTHTASRYSCFKLIFESLSVRHVVLWQAVNFAGTKSC